MTVNVEKNRMDAYTTDGVVVDFDFDLEIYNESEIQVWYEPDGENYYQLTLNTDYGVTFGDGNGTVTTDGYTAALSTGKLLLIRHLDILQETDWFNNDSHSELQHQVDFDRSCMIDLQLQEQIDRVVMLAIHSGTTGIILPEPEANYLLGWNAGGTNLANISVNAIAVLVADLLGDVLATIPATLTDLTDVTITAPAAGHMLRHSGTAWENYACPSSRIIGRKAAGNVDALSAAEARTVLGLDTDDAVTFGDITGGTITGTSFVIGGNSLDTNEWAFLDGQNQALKTTDGPTFENVHISSGETYDLILEADTNEYTADYTLTFNIGESNKKINMIGNTTLDDWFGQDVKPSASPTFVNLTLNRATQDYIFTHRSQSTLAIQSLTSNANPTLEIYTQDGDGDNNEAVSFALIGKGVPTDITTALENLYFQYQTNGAHAIIATTAAGTGTVADISIYTGANTTQLVLATDNNISMSGDLAVTGAITGGSLVVDTTTLVVNAASYEDKVGIGTATPGATLEIQSSTSILRLRDTGATANATLAYVEFGGTDAAAWSRTGFVGDSSSGNTDIYLCAEISDLHLGDSSGYSVLNLQGGNVGIGLTTVDANYKLIIRRAANVNLGIGLQSSELALAAFNDAISANVPMRFYASEFNLLNGNVGINEVAPDSKLEINGDLHVKDKIAFTQDDKNEYIDSLADGYMDYGATTGHRFNNDVAVTGEVSGGTADFGATTVDSLTLDSGGNQDFLIGLKDNVRLYFQGQQANQTSEYYFFTKSGDGTREIRLHLYAMGTPADLTNSESLAIAFYPSLGALSNVWAMWGNESGTGVDHPLHMEFDGSDDFDQLVLLTDGNIAMSGALAVTGAVTGSNLDVAGWDAHIIDATQAHSDYLINDGADETSGVLTAAGFTTAGTVTGANLTLTDADPDIVFGASGAVELLEFRGNGTAANGFSVIHGANTLALATTATVAAFSTANVLQFTSSASTGANALLFTAGAGGMEFRAQTAAKAIALYSPTIKLVGTTATNIGDGGTTNYSAFAADGILTMAGTARVKNNLIIPIEAAQGASAPTVRVTEAPFLSWTFAVNDDTNVSFEVPHDMDFTQDINIYAEWYTSADQTDDEVNWEIDWNAKAEGEAVNAGTTTDTSGDVACPTQWQLEETLVETILANSIAEDDVLGLELKRVAIIDGTNPAVNTIHVLAIHIEYVSNKLGEAT